MMCEISMIRLQRYMNMYAIGMGRYEIIVEIYHVSNK